MSKLFGHRREGDANIIARASMRKATNRIFSSFFPIFFGEILKQEVQFNG